VCLGYPFHPPNQPGKLRTAHLEGLACPALIVQGERDPFGPRAEVEGFTLSPVIRFHWAGDGDHDLGPRGGSGFTRKGNLADAAGAGGAVGKGVAREAAGSAHADRPGPGQGTGPGNEPRERAKARRPCRRGTNTEIVWQGGAGCRPDALVSVSDYRTGEG